MARGGRRARWPLLLAGVLAVAAGARAALLLRSGVLGIGSYDDGVHYAIAVDLVHGRLPYRDVLFLQPPGIALVTAPFAALAGLLGDPVCFVLAKAAFILLGGVNAALTAAVLRRAGAAAALTGGLLYALAFPLVYTERSIALETPGATGVLVAMLLLQRRSPGAALDGRLALLAGAAAGAAVGCKVWYVVALLVLLVAARGARLRFLAGGAAAGCAVYLPFLLPDPAAMWSQVVLAQLGRPQLGDQPLPARVASVLGVSGIAGPTSVPGADPVLLTLVLAAVAALCCVAALTRPAGRVPVALVLTGTAVLLLSPSYFLHYAVLVSAPMALVVGVAVGAAADRARRPAARAAIVAGALAAVVGLNLVQDGGALRLRTPPAGLTAAARAVRGCVLSDDPGVLAAVGTLTRDVAAGCDVHADPSGIGYTAARWTIDGVAVDRDRNPLFQRAIVRYLTSGAAHVVVRQRALLLQPAAEAALTAGTPLYAGDGFVLYPSAR